MVNINRLRGRMVEYGITVAELARALQLHPTTVYRKLRCGGDEFTVDEIRGMIPLLRLSKQDVECIFFTENFADMQNRAELKRCAARHDQQIKQEEQS